MPEVTVGIDIGTTSVKAVAADGDGRVVASVRVPHHVVVPAPDRLEHDANRAWRLGPRRALAKLTGRGDLDVRAVNVAAMVPSLTAVDGRGVPRLPGLLYGDARGRTGSDAPAGLGELLGFLRWAATEWPEARGFWPAQAVANRVLGGAAILDTTAASSAYPFFDFTTNGWDPSKAPPGVEVDRMPKVIGTGQAAGRVGDAVLGSGLIDAFGEQLVAGADEEGDVLVICGTTLITWAVISEWREESGLWTIPHTAPGKILIGGPSNAGGLFLDWAARLLARQGSATDPGRVPVWTPYIRGERTPLHDPDRRAALHGLDLTHDAAAVRRAAFEAAGFVVRHHLERAKVSPRRIVATGGGVRVREWVQALADCTGLPVDVVLVPEGAALGSAFVARVAAGLEAQMHDGARWARTAGTVEPDQRWAAAAAARYGRFLDLTV